jgi:hypothetical protein
MTEKSVQLIQMNISELTEIITSCLAKQLEKIGNLNTQPKKTESEILSREQTKNLLGISYVTLWKHSRNGILTAKKIGSKVFYMRSDIDNLLNQVA